ncbi:MULTISPECIES: hypothetical protein [Kribbella]|nr:MULTISPECIES: hypothetical protein [Kribbella]
MTDPDPAAKANTDPPKPTPDRTAVWVELIKGGVAIVVAALSFFGGLVVGKGQTDNGQASAVTATVTVTPSPTANSSPTAKPSPTARPPVERTMNRPKADELVPVCNTVYGAIPDLPSDKTVVIANEENGDGEIFFEGAVDLATTPKTWRALVHLGNDKDPGRSKTLYYDLWVVVMDRSAVESILAKTGRRQWKSTVFPPNADPGDPVRVKGNGKLGICKLGG